MDINIFCMIIALSLNNSLEWWLTCRKQNENLLVLAILFFNLMIMLCLEISCWHLSTFYKDKHIVLLYRYITSNFLKKVQKYKNDILPYYLNILNVRSKVQLVLYSISTIRLFKLIVCLRVDLYISNWFNVCFVHVVVT